MLKLWKYPPPSRDRIDSLSAAASVVVGSAISPSPMRLCAFVDEARQALTGGPQVGGRLFQGGHSTPTVPTYCSP